MVRDIKYMLYGFLVTLFIFLTSLLILIIMFQRGHGGFWSGPAGGGDSTLLFGGSQGADVLQKITWVLGFIFIFFAFGLSLYRNKLSRTTQYLTMVAGAEAKEEIKKENEQVDFENDALKLLEDNKIDENETKA
jgi:protein translocase SecG subunit